ncbi:uncharacterized protein LOC108665626 isoform X2 [Hyalella azteca]|nr:uncharacterized protein LOC108665626 isoform X2 [Hyalella azteca]
MHQGMGGLLHDPVVGVVGEDGKMPPMQCHPPFSMASLSSELGKIVGRIPGLTSDSPYSSGPHTPATPAGGHNPVDVVPETSSRTAAVSVGESPALGDACAAGGDATDCNIVTPSGADVVPVACTPSEGPATNTLVSPAHEAALTSAPGAISSSVLPCVAPPAALGTEPRRVSRFQVTKVNEASTPVLASPAAPQPPSIIGGAVASPASPSSAPPGWGGDAPSVKRGRFAVTKVQDLSPSTAAVPSPVTEIGAQRSPFTPQQQPSVPQSAMAHQSFIQTAPPQTPQPSLPLQQPQHQPQSQRHPQQATEMTRHNGCPPTHLPLQGHSSGGLGLSPSPLFTSDDLGQPMTQEAVSSPHARWRVPLNDPRRKYFSPNRRFCSKDEDEDSGDEASDEEEPFTSNALPVSARLHRSRLQSKRLLMHHPSYFTAHDEGRSRSKPRIQKTRNFELSSSVEDSTSVAGNTRKIVPQKTQPLAVPNFQYQNMNFSRVDPAESLLSPPPQLWRAKSLVCMRDASTASPPLASSFTGQGPPTPPPRRRRNLLRNSMSVQNVHSHVEASSPLDHHVKLSPAHRRLVYDDTPSLGSGSPLLDVQGHLGANYHTVHASPFSVFGTSPPPRPPSPKYLRPALDSMYHTIQSAGSFSEYDRSSRLGRTTSHGSLRGPALAHWSNKHSLDCSDSSGSINDNLDAMSRQTQSRPHASPRTRHPHSGLPDKNIPDCTLLEHFLLPPVPDPRSAALRPLAPR